jgi:hypothetical protein
LLALLFGRHPGAKRLFASTSQRKPDGRLSVP